MEDQRTVTSVESVTEGWKERTVSKHVMNIKTQAANIDSLLLDADRPLVAVADRDGHIYIHDYSTPNYSEISNFSLTRTITKG